jgi:hypothetical protein
MKSEIGVAGSVCIDCLVGGSNIEELKRLESEGYICEHWRPEFWESHGFVRDWGDAAVMNWPQLEVLRKELREQGRIEVTFIVLAPYVLRRPLKLYAHADSCAELSVWGAY